jgi:hypothetical protein
MTVGPTENGLLDDDLCFVAITEKTDMWAHMSVFLAALLEFGHDP